MKIFIALLAVVASLSGTFAAAAPCIIVDPTLDSVWPIGSSQLISWTNATFTTINVYLDSGSSADYHVNVPPIIANLSVTPNYVYYVVPSTLDNAPIVTGTYAIQFGIAPDVAYGGPIVITNGNAVIGSTEVVVPTTTTTTQAAPPPATTTSSSSSSSSSSSTATTATSTSTTATTAKTSSGSSISPLSLGALLATIPLALLAL